MGFLSRLFRKGDSGTAPGTPATRRRRPEDAVRVEAVSEEYAYLAEHPCDCGGTWGVAQQGVEDPPNMPQHFKLDRLLVACEACGQQASFRFLVNTHSPKYLAEQQEMMRELFGDDADELLGGDDGPPGKKG
jgi:hypothetical protein